MDGRTAAEPEANFAMNIPQIFLLRLDKKNKKYKKNTSMSAAKELNNSIATSEFKKIPIRKSFHFFFFLYI